LWFVLHGARGLKLFGVVFERRVFVKLRCNGDNEFGGRTA